MQYETKNDTRDVSGATKHHLRDCLQPTLVGEGTASLKYPVFISNRLWDDLLLCRCPMSRVSDEIARILDQLVGHCRGMPEHVHGLVFSFVFQNAADTWETENIFASSVLNGAAQPALYLDWLTDAQPSDAEPNFDD